MNLNVPNKVSAHMRIEEQWVHAPREGLATTIEIFVVRDGGKLAAVFRLNVSLMLGMLAFYATDPKDRQEGYVELNIKSLEMIADN